MPGPRIAPLPPEEWDERLTRLLQASSGGIEEPMHIFTTLARAPELFRRWTAFGGALLFGTLPGRLRELVVLRTAARFDGPYEWAQHIELAEREGVSRAEIEAVGGDVSERVVASARGRGPARRRRDGRRGVDLGRNLGRPGRSTRRQRDD